MTDSSRGHSIVVYVGIWSDPDRFQNKQAAAAAVNNTIAPGKNRVNMNFIPFQDSQNRIYGIIFQDKGGRKIGLRPTHHLKSLQISVIFP
jgi:hypothetical protein